MALAPCRCNVGQEAPVSQARETLFFGKNSSDQRERVLSVVREHRLAPRPCRFAAFRVLCGHERSVAGAEDGPTQTNGHKKHKKDTRAFSEPGSPARSATAVVECAQRIKLQRLRGNRCHCAALPYTFAPEDTPANRLASLGVADKQLGGCPDFPAGKMGLSPSQTGKLFFGRPLGPGGRC